MKNLFLSLSLFFVSTSFALQGDEIVGLWVMEPDASGRETIVEVFKEGSKYYANGFAYINDSASDADSANPDPKLQNRLIKHIVFAYDLSFDGKEWSDGEIYNIANGKYYFLKGTLSKDLKHIIWKATIDKAGLFGKTLTWKKLENILPYESKKNSRDVLQKNIPTIRHKK